MAPFVSEGIELARGLGMTQVSFFSECPFSTLKMSVVLTILTCIDLSWNALVTPTTTTGKFNVPLLDNGDPSNLPNAQQSIRPKVQVILWIVYFIIKFCIKVSKYIKKDK